MHGAILKLDREYEVRFGAKALLRLELITGKSIHEVFEEIQGGMSFDFVFTLFRVAVSEFKDLSNEDIAELVDEHLEGGSTIDKLRKVSETIGQAFMAAIGTEEKNVEAPGEAPGEIPEKPANAETAGAGTPTKS